MKIGVLGVVLFGMVFLGACGGGDGGNENALSGVDEIEISFANFPDFVTPGGTVQLSASVSVNGVAELDPNLSFRVLGALVDTTTGDVTIDAGTAVLSGVATGAVVIEAAFLNSSEVSIKAVTETVFVGFPMVVNGCNFGNATFTGFLVSVVDERGDECLSVNSAFQSAAFDGLDLVSRTRILGAIRHVEGGLYGEEFEEKLLGDEFSELISVGGDLYFGNGSQHGNLGSMYFEVLESVGGQVFIDLYDHDAVFSAPELAEIHSLYLNGLSNPSVLFPSLVSVNSGISLYSFSRRMPSHNFSALRYVGGTIYFASNSIVLELPSENLQIDGDGCFAYRESLATGGTRDHLGDPVNIECL